MIRVVKPPILRHQHYRWVLLMYAGVLAAISVLQLVTFETTIEQIAFLTAIDDSTLVSIMAICVVSAQIGSLPYLLRLETSALAYAISAYLSLLAPLLWVGAGMYALYAVTHLALGFRVLLLGVSLGLLAMVAHWAVGIKPRNLGG